MDVTEQDPRAAAEIRGMRMLPTSGQRPWHEVLAGPHPLEVLELVGLLCTTVQSRQQRLMVAYRLHEAGYRRTATDHGED